MRGLEGPLDGQRGIHDGLVQYSEVAADLPFGADAEVELGVDTLELIQVHPQLGLGDEDDIVLARDEMTVAPEVSEAQEGELTTCHVQVPRTRQLEGVGSILTCQILIHRCEGEACLIVCLVPRVGQTCEVGILVGELIAQPAVVLDMQGQRELAEAELTRDLPVGRGDALALIVHIDEEEGIPPAIGAEELHGRGELGALGLVLAVELAPEVVVELNVLCLRSEGSQQEYKRDTIKLSHGWIIVRVKLLLRSRLLAILLALGEE